MNMTRGTSRCLVSLEHHARQPRLAMEANGQADTDTRERTEGATTVVHAMHGNSCSADRVNPGPKATSTSFGVKADPPALPCRDGVLVDNGAAAPKSCLSPMEMSTTAAAGGLLPLGESSTAIKTTFNYSTYWFLQTEDTHSKGTLILSAWCDSSFRRNKLLTAPSCLRVIETKFRQNRMFNPSGFQGHLRACPLSGTWRALLCDEVLRIGVASGDLQHFLGAR